MEGELSAGAVSYLLYFLLYLWQLLSDGVEAVTLLAKKSHARELWDEWDHFRCFW